MITKLAKQTIGAAILTSLMMTASFAFSSLTAGERQPETQNATILAPVQAYSPSFAVARERKQDREAINLSLMDRMKIRQAVLTQLSAFRQKDAQTAYDLSAPVARASFKTPKHFLNDLQDVFGLVSKSIIQRADGLDLSTGAPRQRLLLKSPTGRQWIAYFSMQKQYDGEWKILGLMIEDAPGQII